MFKNVNTELRTALLLATFNAALISVVLVVRWVLMSAYLSVSVLRVGGWLIEAGFLSLFCTILICLGGLLIGWIGARKGWNWILGCLLILAAGGVTFQRHWKDADHAAAFLNEFGAKNPEGISFSGVVHFLSGACSFSVYLVRGEKEDLESLRKRLGLNEGGEVEEINWLVRTIENESAVRFSPVMGTNSYKLDGLREDLHLLLDKNGTQAILVKVYNF